MSNQNHDELRMELKILNLHGSQRGLINRNTNAPIGGLEKTVVDLHNLLNSKGIECWTNSTKADSLEGFYFDINPPLGSMDWSSNKRYSIYALSIKNLIERLRFTHVIVHGANRLARELTKLGIPFLFIDHVMDKSVNKLYHENHFRDVVPKARQNGSRFYSVSNYAKINIEKRIREQNLAEGFVFDGFIKMQYVTDELRNINLAAGDGSAITIGRCDTNKNPAAAVSIAKKANIPLKIYAMMSNSNAKEVKYYETRLKKHSDILKLNHDRSDMLRDLASSSLYISTIPHESAGITAFESLCCGVPVLLMTNNNDHASLIFAPSNSDYIRCMSKNNLDMEWIKRIIGLSESERRNIQKEVYEFNSGDMVVSNLVNELNKMLPLSTSNNAIIRSSNP